MRHRLTTQQFENLWDNVDFDDNIKYQLKYFITMRDARYKLWQKHFRDKYKLLYSETNVQGIHTCYVLGTEDRINWFLLHV